MRGKGTNKGIKRRDTALGNCKLKANALPAVLSVTHTLVQHFSKQGRHSSVSQRAVQQKQHRGILHRLLIPNIKYNSSHHYDLKPLEEDRNPKFCSITTSSPVMFHKHTAECCSFALWGVNECPSLPLLPKITENCLLWVRGFFFTGVIILHHSLSQEHSRTLEMLCGPCRKSLLVI